MDKMKVLVPGAGPIIIGQAAELDYSGSQCCSALREGGHTVVLVNSNPATIQTDPETADIVYIEPMTVESLTTIIEKEKPDAIIPGMGGQTGLNLTVGLEQKGVLKKHGVRILGTSLKSIEMSEDRDLFRKRMKEIDYQGSNYKGPGMIGRNWLTGWISPNGKNWSKIEEPVANNGADGGIIVDYDPFTKEYFSYIRPSGVGRRAIGISKTKDFRNWPPPRLVMYPDHHDDLDVSFYGANYFKYPGLDDLH